MRINYFIEPSISWMICVLVASTKYNLDFKKHNRKRECYGRLGQLAELGLCYTSQLTSSGAGATMVRLVSSGFCAQSGGGLFLDMLGKETCREEDDDRMMIGGGEWAFVVV